MEQDNMNKPQSSVEFSSNTKGYITFSVKVYNENPEFALEKAKELTDKARNYCQQYNGA